MHDNTWKCGERKLCSSPSAGGCNKKTPNMAVNRKIRRIRPTITTLKRIGQYFAIYRAVKVSVQYTFYRPRC